MFKKHLPNIILVALLGSVIALSLNGFSTPALKLKLVEPTAVISFLMVLLLVSAIIERALEFLVAVWFVSGTQLKRIALATAKKTNDCAVITQAVLELAQRKRHVQCYLLLFSLAISMAISIASFRILAQLLVFETNKTESFHSHWFFVTDVIVTAVVLAGGTEGIHKLVSLVTRYLDKTRGQFRGE